ncbi:hypothetical protein AK830_g5087 [Neonectria ditissima]|uniref:Cytochrome b5 heme-binding domain-containing protein n=1 Tax=Neonectria ditissima TaxID=78410 RepID=A0A0N8H7D8_9HYPO|nr:hypothetical protein AK830_g5087 [Neonectria ditissima]
MAFTNTISTLSLQCSTVLDSLFRCAQEGDEKAYQDSVEDDRGRYRVWAANLGALQAPKSSKSLDYRLRDALQMRDSVISGLHRLSSVGERAVGIISATQPNRVAFDNHLEAEEATGPATELEDLLRSIHSSVNHLYGLSVLIRRQRPRGRLPNLEKFTSFEASPDISNVTDKFPKAKDTPWLARRLGNAITRRRQIIQYRQDHRQRLAAQVPDDPAEAPGADTSETVATSFEEGDAGERESISGPSRERHSIFTSATSYLSAYDENGEMGRRIADLSEMVLDGVRLGYDRAFECPVCRVIQNVANRSEWKKHVFSDLQPYVCTFEDCLPDIFSSRSEWFQHELDTHRRKWHCSICSKPGSIFESAKALERHFDTAHAGEITANQMHVMLQACERPLKYFDASSCPLCNDWKPRVQGIENTKEFGRHLARHLQQIALEALPLSIEGLELITDNELTRANVQKHNKLNDLYIIVHDRVYDVTQWADQHPGGEEVLLDVAGDDATEAFEDAIHSDEAREMMEEFLIGKIAEPAQSVRVDRVKRPFSLR